MRTTIFSPYNCLIVQNGKEHFIEEKHKLCLNDNSKILVYPTGKAQLIPFCVDERTSPFYSIIKEDDELLIFLIDGMYCQNIQVHNATFSGGEGKIEIGSNKIEFSSSKHKKIIHLPFSAGEFVCNSLHHIGYVSFSSTQGQHLIFFNFKNGRVKIFEGETITLCSPQFEVKNQNGKSVLLEINKDGLTIKKEECHPAKILANPLLISHSFVQSLKEENFDFAHSLLSSSLQENQHPSSLEAFFGRIDYFFPLSPSRIFVLSGGEGKILTFSLEKGKIADISTD